MFAEPLALTVFFEGTCPLCKAEIALYRKDDVATQVCFRDASRSGEFLEPDLVRAQALVRFHVRRSDVQLIFGAAAFVSIWRCYRDGGGLTVVSRSLAKALWFLKAGSTRPEVGRTEMPALIKVGTFYQW